MRFFRVLIPMLFFCMEAHGQVSREEFIANKIKAFYVCYLEAFCNDKDDDEALSLKDFITPEMLEKRARLICATDADPLTRSQDVSGNAAQTVTCHHLDGDWYEVSFRLGEGDTLTYIPLKVSADSLGIVRISYVTSEWGGRAYGDSLFNLPQVMVVDDKDAATFVETFYRRYTYLYCQMPHSLDRDLAKMVKGYCISALTKKIVRKKKELQDMESCYDPIIGYGDFDVSFYASLKVEPVCKDVFSVSYAHVKLKVKVVRKKGRYKIADVGMK